MRFFRKIRQELALQVRVREYLLYALGHDRCLARLAGEQVESKQAKKGKNRDLFGKL